MALLNDIAHFWGNDLAPAANGDLLAASGTLRGQQRILRRLMTNPGDYVFAPLYGAGLPKYVGSVASVDQITALIRGQMLLEAAVAKTPAPIIAVTAINNGISVQVTYNDAASNAPVILSFKVNT